jgi:hypothetical protein
LIRQLDQLSLLERKRRNPSSVTFNKQHITKTYNKSIISLLFHTSFIYPFDQS